MLFLLSYLKMSLINDEIKVQFLSMSLYDPAICKIWLDQLVDLNERCLNNPWTNCAATELHFSSIAPLVADIQL